MRKAIKITAIVLASIIGFLVVTVGGYVIYLLIQFYRIEDNQIINTDNNQDAMIVGGEEYSISTLNIGFGAYDKDFHFFFDSGEMTDGTKVSGKMSRGKDEQTVVKNVEALIDGVKPLAADFMFFQEVDIDATRSYGINQHTMLTDSFPSYAAAKAINFHSGYLMYPFDSPHGANTAAQSTLSKYKITSNLRRSFPVDMSFPGKFFELDRCYMITRLPVENGKELVLINLHMSAYDEGGTFRAQQLEMLNNELIAEAAKGNYVIAGGDFNHDIAGSKELYPCRQKLPSWLQDLTDEDVAEGFRVAKAINVPTCRAAEIPYEKGVNHTVVVDGFMVSENIQIIESKNIDLDFQHSDHNPAYMKFKLL